ncbi:MAG: Crp/Fnr family transcriptional regulator [Polaromonas sp.]|nr:Crp/Fnr family transcriptional regulator [Polaromonas sp.]
MSPQKDVSLKNLLVASLPPAARALLLEHSELVELALHAVLTSPGEPAKYAYSPIDSFVSVILPIHGAADMELALVGNEGMFNTSTALGVADSCFVTRVQGAGRALKIRRDALRMRRAEDADLRHILFRYIDVRTCQLAQKAACMTYHTVEQRLARSLLMVRDRAHSTELFLTHESLALMLGVRRESVSQAANTFQKRGLINYGRGYVILLEELDLKHSACSCYQSDLDIYARTLFTEPVFAYS